MATGGYAPPVTVYRTRRKTLDATSDSAENMKLRQSTEGLAVSKRRRKFSGMLQGASDLNR